MKKCKYTVKNTKSVLEMKTAKKKPSWSITWCVIDYWSDQTLTFLLQVGDGLIHHRWDGCSSVLLPDAANKHNPLMDWSIDWNHCSHIDRSGVTHYCRLTPNCWVGRGGRGGGAFTGGGGPPFWAARNFSSCLNTRTRQIRKWKKNKISSNWNFIDLTWGRRGGRWAARSSDELGARPGSWRTSASSQTCDWNKNQKKNSRTRKWEELRTAHTWLDRWVHASSPDQRFEDVPHDADEVGWMNHKQSFQVLLVP